MLAVSLFAIKIEGFYFILVKDFIMALRLAVQSALHDGEKNLSDGAEALNINASMKLLDIAKNSSGSGGLALVAVGATVLALETAYTSIEKSKAASLVAADTFTQACEAGTATFFVPESPGSWGEEQRAFLNIKKYLHDKDPIFVKYANIHVTENFHQTVNNKTVKGTSYSIISYANLFLSNAYENSPGDDKILEAAKHSCDLFIKAKLSDILDTITDENFHIRKWFCSHNLYQRLHFVRILTIAFANILISLQHPPTLDIKGTINLCGQVIDGVNDILLSDRFRFIRTQMFFHNDFIQYLTSLRREAENLQLGYKSKILNEISLFEVVGKCHGILQGTNSLWHEILFKDSPNTQPDHLLYIVRCITFAVHILDTVGTEKGDDHKRISNWIMKHGILESEHNRDGPVSVIGLITGFSKWLVKKQQSSAVVAALRGLGVEANELDLLAKNFVQPMRKLFEAYRVPNMENKIPQILEQLIALSIESCLPFLPEEFHGEDVYQSCAKLNLNRELLRNDLIWHQLSETEAHGRQLKKTTIGKMKELLKAEFGFLDAVRLFTKMQALLEKNRLFLLREDSQSQLKELLCFLEARLGTFRTKMNDLYVAVNNNDRIVTVNKSSDSSHNKARKAILSTLSEEGVLRNRLDILQADIERIQRILASTRFSDRLKKQVMGDWSTIVNAGVVEEEETLDLEAKKLKEEEMKEEEELKQKQEERMTRKREKLEKKKKEKRETKRTMGTMLTEEEKDKLDAEDYEHILGSVMLAFEDAVQQVTAPVAPKLALSSTAPTTGWLSTSYIAQLISPPYNLITDHCL